MSYARPFLRLAVIGRLYDAEDFTFTVSLIQGPNGPAEPPSTVPPFIESALATFINGTPGLISSHAAIHSIKLNEIGTDGRYTSGTTVEDDLTVPITGGSSATPAPQVALVVSLRTAVSRGYAHSGRFYLPLPGTPVNGADGRISIASASDAANGAAYFLSQLNEGFNDAWVAGVTSSVGVGKEHVITGVAVGRVLDTIRSRRSSLDEDYQVEPLP